MTLYGVSFVHILSSVSIDTRFLLASLYVQWLETISIHIMGLLYVPPHLKFRLKFY